MIGNIHAKHAHLGAQQAREGIRRRLVETQPPRNRPPPARADWALLAAPQTPARTFVGLRVHQRRAYTQRPEHIVVLIVHPGEGRNRRRRAARAAQGRLQAP